MTTKHFTTFAIAGATMIATLAMAVMPADASDRTRYRCRAKGNTDISMDAKFEIRPARNRNKFSVEFEDDLPQKVRDSDAEASPDVREEEIRQLLEAKAYRQSSRGEAPPLSRNRGETRVASIPFG